MPGGITFSVSCPMKEYDGSNFAQEFFYFRKISLPIAEILSTPYDAPTKLGLGRRSLIVVLSQARAVRLPRGFRKM